MACRYCAKRRLGEPEKGFTLMEVVISLSLLAIIASAALYFFIGGTRAVTHQQRSHGAVALANDAMEEAFSWVPTASTTGTSGLVVGRTQAEVLAAWGLAATANVSGVADTFPAWDTATLPAPIDGTGDDVIDLTSSATESGSVYQVTTLIGTCYRSEGTADDPCDNTVGDEAGTPVGGFVRLMRVIVTVAWPDTVGSCGGTSCSYEISALIDPNSDVEWNNTTRMVPVDDSVTVPTLADVEVDVLANDVLPQIATNPVTILSQTPLEAVGAGISSVNPATGGIVYKRSAAPKAHGIVLVKYQVLVGVKYGFATLHLYVVPQAFPVSVTTPPGVPVSVPLTDVMSAAITGAGALEVTRVSTSPSVATGVSSFQFPASALGSYSYTYTYLDPDSGRSLPGTVTIVVGYPTPVAPPITVQLNDSAAPVDINLITPTQAGYKVRIKSLPGAGTLRVDGQAAAVNLTGAAATFTPLPSNVREYTFNYVTVTPDGVQESPPALVTVKVKAVPVPVPENSTKTVKKSNSITWNLKSTPSSNVEFQHSVVTCGTLSNFVSTSPSITFNASKNTGTCTFTYQVRGTVPETDWSSPATITVNVTNN
jgi:prepilin-type N-terminal cleavage/methylation domain-containing protein